PAASMTDGFEVFVQLVMAAMTTEPCVRSPVLGGVAEAPGASNVGSAWVNDLPASRRFTRSWGRFGPATLGSTVPRSSSSVSEYTASGVDSVWKSPCSRQYASTSAIRSAARPERRRYRMVSASTGKMPHVAPYSG